MSKINLERLIRSPAVFRFTLRKVELGIKKGLLKYKIYERVNDGDIKIVGKYRNVEKLRDAYVDKWFEKDDELREEVSRMRFGR